MGLIGSGSSKRATVAVKLLFFAGLRDRLQRSGETTALPAKIGSNDILTMVSKKYPAVAELLPSCRVAVNGEFIEGRVRLKSGDEVAILPPVAGG